jgi:hypothetical protein
MTPRSFMNQPTEPAVASLPWRHACLTYYRFPHRQPDVCSCPFVPGMRRTALAHAWTKAGFARFVP